MGMFDLFKKKEQPKENNQESKIVTEPYLGDLNKTAEIYNLIKTPPSDRDENWNASFLSLLSSASFRCGDPQVITGPDGLPYFQLFLPEPNTSFQCYVIDKMKDDFLLEHGYGVVINPTGNQPDWVLSYGDILNFHLNHSFYTYEDTPFSKVMTDEVINEAENVMIGQPSEELLPFATRKIMEAFLKMNGVESPKVLLMMRHTNDNTSFNQDLAFNIIPSNFENEESYRYVMQTLSWFLPRHYSFVGLDEKKFDDVFTAL
jgi:hypothetical protein